MRSSLGAATVEELALADALVVSATGLVAGLDPAEDPLLQAARTAAATEVRAIRGTARRLVMGRFILVLPLASPIVRRPLSSVRATVWGRLCAVDLSGAPPPGAQPPLQPLQQAVD